METGHRKDKDGKPIARDILNTFIAKFGDLGFARTRSAYRPTLHLVQMRVPGPGTFEFAWIDDNSANRGTHAAQCGVTWWCRRHAFGRRRRDRTAAPVFARARTSPCETISFENQRSPSASQRANSVPPVLNT
jgi:hypothetical protein